MTRKCYSVSRSAIDENNDSVRKSWIVFRHEIVAKFTYAAEFSTAEDLAFCFRVGGHIMYQNVLCCGRTPSGRV